MAAAGTAGEIAGGIAGGAAGGAIGSLVLPPIGTAIGRWLGSRLGRVAGRAIGEALSQDMVDADDQAEADDAEADDTDDCENCRTQECIDLEADINRRMYNSKRRATGPGEQPNGYHGQFPRRAEQICGEGGPGTAAWGIHDEILKQQQGELEKLYEKYLNAGCLGHDAENINWGDYQWATDPSFPPSPSQHLGPNHPLCQSVPDMIRQGRGRDAVIQLNTPQPPAGPALS